MNVVLLYVHGILSQWHMGSLGAVAKCENKSISVHDEISISYEIWKEKTSEMRLLVIPAATLVRVCAPVGLQAIKLGRTFACYLWNMAYGTVIMVVIIMFEITADSPWHGHYLRPGPHLATALWIPCPSL